MIQWRPIKGQTTNPANRRDLNLGLFKYQANACCMIFNLSKYIQEQGLGLCWVAEVLDEGLGLDQGSSLLCKMPILSGAWDPLGTPFPKKGF